MRRAKEKKPEKRKASRAEVIEAQISGLQLVLELLSAGEKEKAEDLYSTIKHGGEYYKEQMKGEGTHYGWYYFMPSAGVFHDYSSWRGSYTSQCPDMQYEVEDEERCFDKRAYDPLVWVQESGYQRSCESKVFVSGFSLIDGDWYSDTMIWQFSACKDGSVHVDYGSLGTWTGKGWYYIKHGAHGTHEANWHCGGFHGWNLYNTQKFVVSKGTGYPRKTIEWIGTPR